MTFTRRLAHFAVENVSFDSLPPQVVAQSKEMMINAAAVGLAGAAQDQGRTLDRPVSGHGRQRPVHHHRFWDFAPRLSTPPWSMACWSTCWSFDDEIQGVA